MINIIVVHDDASTDIGANCLLCYQCLSNGLLVNTYAINVLDGSVCSKINVENTIISFNEKPFVFIAYSHGSLESLDSELHGRYVETSNSYFFGSSLFYTNSCLSGQDLARALLENDCRIFIGFEDAVYVPDEVEDEELFISCENYAIIEFLNSEKPIGTCILEMEQLYQNTLDELVDGNRFFLASRLNENLERLVYYGDLTLNRNDFLNTN